MTQARFATRLLAGVAASAVTVFSIAAPVLAQEEKTQGGTITVALETEPNGFEPLEGRIFGQTGSTVAITMEEPLLGWNHETNEPLPLLATSKAAVNMAMRTVAMQLKEQD